LSARAAAKRAFLVAEAGAGAFCLRPFTLVDEAFAEVEEVLEEVLEVVVLEEVLEVVTRVVADFVLEAAALLLLEVLLVLEEEAAAEETTLATEPAGPV
jgi:hypothetical protein